MQKHKIVIELVPILSEEQVEEMRKLIEETLKDYYLETKIMNAIISVESKSQYE